MRLPALLMTLLAVSSLVEAERIALLPFANYSSDETARELTLYHCAKTLSDRGLEIANQDSVEKSLRRHRIRNTALPSEKNLQDLAEDLNAAYVLTGSIHRFVTGDAYSEAAFSARLIRVDDGTLLWCNSISISGGGEVSIFSSPAYNRPAHLAKVASRKLLSALSLTPKLKKRVTALRGLASDSREIVPCEKIAVIPPTNEAETEFSGELFGETLVSELMRRGFSVVDPGKVRTIMLASEDLRYGQSVEAVSRALSDSLNVDLVLTGSVSELTDVHSASLGGIPRAAAELRLINPLNNTVVWSRALERHGNRSFTLFGSAATRSPATLAHELVRDAVRKLRVVRTRAATS